VKFINPDGKDISPVVRLLMELNAIKPKVPAKQTLLVLFDDDKPGMTERADFCEKIETKLVGFGLDGLEVKRAKISIARPTDLHGLYVEVGESLRNLDVRSFGEVLFHVSSGTFHMQLTLILIASALPPEGVRLFQTSAHKDGSVQELHLPYVVAARADSSGHGRRARQGLEPGARRSLLENSVVEDAAIAEVYQALFKAATGRRGSPRILLFGPIGSGKWHACRQFAKWRKTPGVVVWDVGCVPGSRTIPDAATVLVHRLDRWPAEALPELATLSTERPDIAIAATFRTGGYSASRSAVLSDGLPGAAHFHLPALDRRSDVIPLGRALARQNGIPDGKLHARLQHDWMTDVFPRGLHDLKTLVTTGALLSGSKHLERESYIRAAEGLAARDVLADAWAILDELTFPPGLSFDQVHEDIRRAVYVLACERAGSQTAAEALIGTPQQTISRVLGGGVAAYHLRSRFDETGDN
jgi:hypothetical protein